VRTPHIALPNVLLGRRAYPELLQDDVTEERVAGAARELLRRRDASRADAAELRAELTLAGDATFGERVAASLEDWLS
jgi:lipid-A-disaccharide synthase